MSEELERTGERSTGHSINLCLAMEMIIWPCNMSVLRIVWSYVLSYALRLVEEQDES